MGLKKSQDMNINMTQKQPKEFLLKLAFKKYQDININMVKKAKMNFS